VLIRCDGGPAIGLGHVKRCLAIAQSLRGEHGLKCLLAGRFEDGAAALVRAQNIPQIDFLDGGPSRLPGLASRSGAQAALFDIRTDLPRSALDALKAAGVAIITLDDASERRLAADLAVLPPTPAALALDWPGFHGEALIGWAWQVLAAKPVRRAVPDERAGPVGLLVTMGGADLAGLTRRCAQALLPLAGSIAPIFVIGPAFAEPMTLRGALRALWPKAEIALRPESLAPVMAKADLALAAYGVTAQELAASGVPALYLGLSEDHVASAAALAATGAGLCLGRHDRLGDAQLREAVAALAGDAPRRKAMALAGPKALDGQGAGRLAARIAELVRIRMMA
jgi:spore coat polysaccharide biosynthesis protein SpsF